MLEAAIESWSSPKLIHTVVTGSDLQTYKLFIERFKRRLSAANINFDYKGCEEVDGHKGQHVHVMWIVDSDCPETYFNADASNSTLNKVMASIQQQTPSFNVHVCQPQRYESFAIPLTLETLQCAADYLSYVYKARSKQKGHRYLSSRSTSHRRRIANTELNTVKQMRVFKQNYSANKTQAECSFSRYSTPPLTLHVGVHSSARHTQSGGNRSFSHAIRDQVL